MNLRESSRKLYVFFWVILNSRWPGMPIRLTQYKPESISLLKFLPTPISMQYIRFVF
ncbi:hypothetical protein EV283_3802 [Sphingomonas sp. BK036]|nr:hypothetical protein EV283_3802 [Sphingomonas sp. BK036]